MSCRLSDVPMDGLLMLSDATDQLARPLCYILIAYLDVCGLFANPELQCSLFLMGSGGS
jgi:hypothetical protein